MISKFKIGDTVKKVTGDYYYIGVVVAVFTKLNGIIRLVVENKDGMLFIFNENSLEYVAGNKSEQGKQ